MSICFMNGTSTCQWHAKQSEIPILMSNARMCIAPVPSRSQDVEIGVHSSVERDVLNFVWKVTWTGHALI